MKVILFCGGLGTRLREHSGTIPKPLVNIGPRPIIWHLMKYYASFGHTEFILCLGYGGEMIRRFFLDYDLRDSEDFVLENGRSRTSTSSSDVADWRIHFVDTGLNSVIGERLVAVKEYVDDDELFLVNYSDQLSDLPLDEYVDWFKTGQYIGGFLAVHPSQSFHVVESEQSGKVTALRHVEETDTLINGGFMIFRKAVFDYIVPGEELVEEPFQRLIQEEALGAYRYEGFWKAMDTVKDKRAYDDLHAAGRCPWVVWSR